MGGLFDFFTQKGGLLDRGAYLRGGGLNREITVLKNQVSIDLCVLVKLKTLEEVRPFVS